MFECRTRIYNISPPQAQVTVSLYLPDVLGLLSRSNNVRQKAALNMIILIFELYQVGIERQ